MDTGLSRRDLLGGAGAVATLGLLAPFFTWEAMASSSKEAGDKPAFAHKLPPLPYSEDALEPIIDRQTVNIHYNKHFAGYVTGLNDTLDKLEKARAAGDFSAIKSLSRDLAFHGSGVVLHWIYFTTVRPKPAGPSDAVRKVLARDFGSFDNFWKQFAAATNQVEASGWGILGWEPFSKRLVIMQAEKHQNLTSWGLMPLLVCDVWEHAYYLKYQNRRSEYVENFKNIIDWKKVEERFATYCSRG